MFCIGPSAHLPAAMPAAYTAHLSLLDNSQILNGLNPDSHMWVCIVSFSLHPTSCWKIMKHWLANYVFHQLQCFNLVWVICFFLEQILQNSAEFPMGILILILQINDEIKVLLCQILQTNVVILQFEMCKGVSPLTLTKGQNPISIVSMAFLLTNPDHRPENRFFIYF